jgi:hypothetical protein
MLCLVIRSIICLYKYRLDTVHGMVCIELNLDYNGRHRVEYRVLKGFKGLFDHIIASTYRLYRVKSH